MRLEAVWHWGDHSCKGLVFSFKTGLSRFLCGECVGSENLVTKIKYRTRHSPKNYEIMVLVAWSPGARQWELHGIQKNVVTAQPPNEETSG
jgi:hypothetical protein